LLEGIVVTKDSSGIGVLAGVFVIEVVSESGLPLLGCFTGEESSDTYNLVAFADDSPNVVPEVGLRLGKERSYAPLAIVTLGARYFSCVSSRACLKVSYTLFEF
jgi:hypothetical protein